MRVLNRKNATFLILLSCLTYSTAYVGRLCYGANLSLIRGDFGVDQAIAGTVSSFYFFSYAAGQLINAFIAKYCNPKYTVTVAMLVSALCNLGIGLSPSIEPMKYIWLVNGLAQSMLWCNILNIQSRFLASKDIGRCIIWNCMTYSIGTFVSYGVSALLKELEVSWRAVFFFSFASVFAVGLAWFFGVRRTEYAFHHDGAEIEAEPKKEAASPAPAGKVRLFTPYFTFVFVFACVGAACSVFIRDGVVTWLPSILEQDFGVKESLSILLTMILPEISLLGAFLVKWMKKYLRSHLFLECLLFTVAGLSVFAIALLYSLKNTVLTLLFFAVMYLMVCGIVNVTTSLIPFSIRKYGNVGSISALLDACCYAGAVCSTYAFGAIADNGGWKAVIWIAALVAVISAGVVLIGSLLAKRTALTKEIL
ncbi:MAG: MFS transporter [Clostridia bacterium]|nr:MFS transporter [Clostridia bacterium]